MEKKTLLAVVLSIAVLVIYYGFLYQPPAPPVSPPAQPTAASETQPTATSASPVKTKTPPREKIPNKVLPEVESNTQTQLINAQLSSKSGFPKNWELKSYFEQADQKGPNTDLLKGEGLPIRLLMYPGRAPLDPYFTKPEVSQEGLQLKYAEAVPGAKLAVEQELQFSQDNYSVEVKLKVKNQSSGTQIIAPGIRIKIPPKPQENGGGILSFVRRPNIIQPLYRMGPDVERLSDVDKLGAYQEAQGEVAWAGLEDRYFLRAVLARKLSPNNKAAYGKKDGLLFADFQYPARELSAGSEKEFNFTLYLGPKDPTYLKGFAGAELGTAIDYGFFAIVAKPILISLKFFYSFLKNWGLAIILLTLVIKVLLHPLTRKSMASMKAMQQIQPELKKIREKFKDDRDRLNMETMNLFKRHKVNPMGGCLPMLLQMPIYIALYNVLYNATELYHAPFFWFYRDLSAPDPYFILPVLLGLSMVAQQKMTPTTGDPMQAKMMMIMPIMFSVFMLFLPLGLVLYIFVNTIITVVQQWMHQKDVSFIGLIKGKPS